MPFIGKDKLFQEAFPLLSSRTCLYDKAVFRSISIALTKNFQLIKKKIF